eukprot:gene32376-35262_t
MATGLLVARSCGFAAARGAMSAADRDALRSLSTLDQERAYHHHGAAWMTVVTAIGMFCALSLQSATAVWQLRAAAPHGGGAPAAAALSAGAGAAAAALWTSAVTCESPAAAQALAACTNVTIVFVLPLSGLVLHRRSCGCPLADGGAPLALGVTVIGVAATSAAVSFVHPAGSAVVVPTGVAVCIALIVAQQRALGRADPPPQRHPGALLSLSLVGSAGPPASARILAELSTTANGFVVFCVASALFTVLKAVVGALAVHAVPAEARVAVLWPMQVAEDWVLTIILLGVPPWSLQYFLLLAVTLAWDVQRDATLLRTMLHGLRGRCCKHIGICRRWPLRTLVAQVELAEEERLVQQVAHDTAGMQNIITETPFRDIFGAYAVATVAEVAGGRALAARLSPFAGYFYVCGAYVIDPVGDTVRAVAGWRVPRRGRTWCTATITRSACCAVL